MSGLAGSHCIYDIVLVLHARGHIVHLYFIVAMVPHPPTGVYVDARRLTLQGGLQIIVLIKGGEAFIPNPELAKVLPVVSRTAMDQIRTQCGVTVTLASKGEIGEGGRV